MVIRVSIILALVIAIAGGTWYFVDELYLKEKKLDREEKQKIEAAAQATPTPHPSLAVFEKIKPLLDKNTPEAQTALKGFLQDYPDSPMGSTVRAALGRINVEQIFSPTASPDKTVYVVQSGDSLVKIASKFKTGAELIYRANNLSTINLKIGQELVIPKLDTSLVIDRAARTVTVLNAGAFLKEYPTISLKLPAAANSGTIQTKVNDRLAMKGNKRVAFGTKDFDGSERWVMLSLAGVSIRSMPDAEGEGDTPPPPPPGIVVTPADAAEISVLVTRGTPVTIQ